MSRTQGYQISGSFTGFVRPSVRLSQMNYVEYLINLTTQLDNTSLSQPVTKQCFMLFSLCVKRALAITENTLKKTWSAQSVRIIFALKVSLVVTVWRIFGYICNSLLYFALLTYLNYSVLITLVKQYKKLYLVSEFLVRL